MPRDATRALPLALLIPLAPLVLLAVLDLQACSASGTRFPWPAVGKLEARESFEHAEVTTVNRAYARDRSQVLVRRVKRPTRANLDYAAYHANFMNADPEPEGMDAGAGKRPDASHPFAGALEPSTLTGSLASTPLTAAERSHPLAVVPMVEWLTSKHAPAADRLEDIASKVRAESWGLGGGPQAVRQTATELYFHAPPGGAAGGAPEFWMKVEFAPWFKSFGALPDDDGDGFGAVYGRVPADALGPSTGPLVQFIHDEYAGHVLSATEVTGWAHQLASYWYPSYNTDLVGGAGGSWPDDQTEPEVVRELGGQHFDAPTVVMRGKPQGKPVYNVFLVDGLTTAGDANAAAGKASAALVLARSTPSPAPAAVANAIRDELRVHGGSWGRWAEEVAPIRELVQRTLQAMPGGIKATAGNDGFLFFRQSLAYAASGDLAKQRRGKNPLPVIVQWKKRLAEHGVDFLFVPVPTKEEVFPDKLARNPADQAIGARFVGKVVNPFERKLLLDLADKGVETIDLLPTFLRERATPSGAPTRSTPPLFQAQDTHWTSRGIELAAQQIAARVRQYPWYGELARHRKKYALRDAPFSRHGDLHSRLPESDKAGYPPENLVGSQVLGADGVAYDDDPDSPIVVLGDSFTGVFELMDCEHAGISAHIAAQIGYPADLVMSYGGGPNVRQKLLRRGPKALDTKKLVIWMMTARDLYDFWEGWQPVSDR
jgi:SGNH hydrolase-like domain, acetyltransferase AlgX